MTLHSSIPGFLADPGPHLLLFGGKGGTGKTTCAAAAALYLATKLPSEKILLISTDPAHSIRDSLADLQTPPNLETIELDAAFYLNEFKEKHGPKLVEIANRGTILDKEDILRFLDLSMPGMDELFGFLEISRLAAADTFTRIVVDTAPTGHTLRLLAMPRAFEGWLEALDSLLAKHRYMKKVFRGFYQPDDLDEFLENLEESRQRMEQILRDYSKCRFVPVMIAENLVVSETARLIKELDGFKIKADEILVNRMHPENDCALCSRVRHKQVEVLSRLPEEIAERLFWLLPLFPIEVRGEPLTRFWSEPALLPKPQLLRAKEPSQPLPRYSVEDPAPLPTPAARLLLFAGKGGVGKTTLACATALHLVAKNPEKKILLFSADPAHSVSDALEMELGPSPVEILPRLFAMEIDPESEFELLKVKYRSEIDEFFESVLGNLDLTFDREVMERMLDLSPPGLDEIMSITRIIDFLDSGEYNLLILDTAPTGHFIRLLELPEILDQWIKAFFELLLKYRNIIRLPQMSERLVSLSKSLKRLREVLRGNRSLLYAVAIPTELAREETSDLISSCERTEIAVPVIFINMVTPPVDCSFCSQIRQRESEAILEMSRQFSGRIRTIVYRQSDPRGINLLSELGKSLYIDA